MLYVTTPVLVFLLSLLGTWLLSRPNRWVYVLDHPNDRSLHSIPTPRTGGLALVAAVGTGLVISTAVLELGTLAHLALLAGLLAILSFLDDRFELSVLLRLSCHLAISLLAFAAGLRLEALTFGTVTLPFPTWLAASLTGLFLTWMINLYNFMDGMDGFAGGMAVFVFGTLAAVGLIQGNLVYGLFNLIIAAVALGLLVFNLVKNPGW